MPNELLIAIEELLDRKLEEKLEEKLEQKLEQKLDQKLDQKLAPVHERLDKLEQKVDKLDERVDRLEQKVDKLDERMHHMELTLENEIRPNIMRVAEGHLDLNRKLSEATTRSAEMEKMAVMVNYHDVQIRKLIEAGAVV